MSDFWLVPFETYKPVRRQLLGILRKVNERRKRAGRRRIPPSAIPLQRKIVSPFAPPDRDAA